MPYPQLILLGLKLLSRLGPARALYPVGLHVRQALLALKADDLDGAMRCYREARRRDFGHEKVGVLREILRSEMAFRRRALVERSAKAPAEAEKREADAGITVLDRFLEELSAEGGV